MPSIIIKAWVKQHTPVSQMLGGREKSVSLRLEHWLANLVNELQGQEAMEEDSMTERMVATGTAQMSKWHILHTKCN